MRPIRQIGKGLQWSLRRTLPELALPEGEVIPYAGCELPRATGLNDTTPGSVYVYQDDGLPLSGCIFSTPSAMPDNNPARNFEATAIRTFRYRAWLTFPGRGGCVVDAVTRMSYNHNENSLIDFLRFVANTDTPPTIINGFKAWEVEVSIVPTGYGILRLHGPVTEETATGKTDEDLAEDGAMLLA